MKRGKNVYQYTYTFVLYVTLTRYHKEECGSVTVKDAIDILKNHPILKNFHDIIKLDTIVVKVCSPFQLNSEIHGSFIQKLLENALKIKIVASGDGSGKSVVSRNFEQGQNHNSKRT